MIIFLCFILCFAMFFGSLGFDEAEVDVDACFEYLNTLERHDNVYVYCASLLRYVYFTDGAVDIDSLTGKIGLADYDFRMITASDEYIFFNTYTKPSDIYRVKRDLSDWEEIGAMPSYCDYTLNGYELCYTDDGMLYVQNLLTDVMFGVVDEDDYDTYLNTDRKYIATDAGAFSACFKVKNTETGKVVYLREDRFKDVEEISGSILEENLTAYHYAYYEDDIYFCSVAAYADGKSNAALIFKYDPEKDYLSFYSWLDTSAYGQYDALNFGIF